MEMIYRGLAYTVALSLIFLGTITTKTQAQPPPSAVAEDAVNKLQDPLDGPTQPAPKLKAGDRSQSAPTLFRQGKFAEAERQFAWIAQVRKGTTWGERSQYYLAECQYRQKKYVEALDEPGTPPCRLSRDRLLRPAHPAASSRSPSIGSPGPSPQS